MLIVIYIPKKKIAPPYMWGYPLSKKRFQKTTSVPIESHTIFLVFLVKAASACNV